MIGAYRVLVGKPEGRKPLGSPGRRWEDNIKMYFHKWDGEAWNELAFLRIGTLEGACECGNEHLVSM
jgi:hypothetical protein